MVSKSNVAQRKTEQQRISFSQELLDRVDAAQEAECEALERRRRGERSSPMFTFARFFPDRDEMEVVTVVGKILQMRYPTASDPWAEAFPEYGDAKFALEERLLIVQFPIGMFDRAVAIAKGSHLPIKSGRGAKYDLFLAICAALQKLRGHGNDFFLTQTRMAAALNVPQSMVSAYVARAKKDGFLRETQPYVKKQRSTYFLFSQQTDTKDSVVLGVSVV